MFLAELNLEWSLTLQEFYALPCTIHTFCIHCHHDPSSVFVILCITCLLCYNRVKSMTYWGY